MADVCGTDVLYTSESKLGLTTLTFRKRRYMFPSVIVKGNEPLSGSTSSLQSTGACLMLDVGLFCPHCSGAISAQLSESHSKLIISKEDGGPIASLQGRDVHCFQLPVEQSGPTAGYTTTIEAIRASTEAPHQSKHAKVKKIRKEQDGSQTEEPRLKLKIHPVTSPTHGDLMPPFAVETVDKMSSSDYESLDQDSRFGSLSSTVNSAEIVISPPGSTNVSSPKRDDAYSSMVSSGQGSFHEGTGSQFPPTIHSSLPRNIHFSSSIHDSRARLNNVYTNMMAQSDHNAVDDVFHKDLLNGHGNSVHESTAPSFQNGAFYPANGDIQKAVIDKFRSEDDLSNRSTSPETFVDDILENVGGEVYSVDATLPRVFSLKTEHGRKSHSAKRKTKHHRVQPCSNNSVDNENTSAMNRTAKHRDNLEEECSGLAMRSSFSHEDFFEEVFEALTELEEGLTPERNSAFRSDRRETLSTPDSGHVVDEHDSEMYGDSLGFFERSVPYPPTSSCECLADDRSHDLDSSLEHFPSIAETPSETSVGDYSLEGYLSSSDESEAHRDSTSKPSVQLLEQLLEETRTLTESLNVLSSDDTDDHILLKDQYDVTDEVFLDDEQSSFPPDENVSIHYCKVANTSENRYPSQIPRIIHTEESQNDICSDSDESSIHESSSLENLLSCNALHCSTSDLDEPYATELKHNGIIEMESENVEDNRDKENGIEEDFQRCLQTKTLETDEFVPERDQETTAEPQVLKQAYEAAQYVASLIGSHHITEPQLCKVHAGEAREHGVTGESTNTESKSTFDKVVQSGEWKDFTSEADTKVASFETKENMSKEQAQQFLKYVLSQSSHTQHTKEHTSDLDACLDEVCQTCELKAEKEEENIIVKNEEVTTQEVTFVFAWPKKLAKGRNLVPASDKPGQPFRTLHLRRVMRVSDFDMEVVEGPTIETVEYTKEGTAKRSIQAFEGPVTTKQITDAHHNAVQATSEQKSEPKSEEENSNSPKLSDSICLSVNAEIRDASEAGADRNETLTVAGVNLPKEQNITEHTVIGTHEVDGVTITDGAIQQDPGIYKPGSSETDSGTTDSNRDAARRAGKASSPMFIEQKERNVKLLKLEKYFSPSSSSEGISLSNDDIHEAGDTGVSSEELESSTQIFMLQASTQPDGVYETCSEIPLCAMDIADKGKLRRYGLFGHPVPCERCIALERELKEKLEELSSIVEGLGMKKRLADSKGPSMEENQQCSEDRQKLDSQPSMDTGDATTTQVDNMDIKSDDSDDQASEGGDTFPECYSDYLDPMREIEHYADNLSKYILFRAKLYIVLNNATVVPPLVSKATRPDTGASVFRVPETIPGTGTVQHAIHHDSQHHMHASLADTLFHNPHIDLESVQNVDYPTMYANNDLMLGMYTPHSNSCIMPSSASSQLVQSRSDFMVGIPSDLELPCMKEKLHKTKDNTHTNLHDPSPRTPDKPHLPKNHFSDSASIRETNIDLRQYLQENSMYSCKHITNVCSNSAEETTCDFPEISDDETAMSRAKFGKYHDTSPTAGNISLIVCNDSDVHYRQDGREHRQVTDLAQSCVDVVIILSSDNNQVPQLTIPLSDRVESLDIVVNMSKNEVMKRREEASHGDDKTAAMSALTSAIGSPGKELNMMVHGAELVPDQSLPECPPPPYDGAMYINEPKSGAMLESTQAVERRVGFKPTPSDLDIAIHKNLDELAQFGQSFIGNHGHCSSGSFDTFTKTEGNSSMTPDGSESSSDEDTDVLFDQLISLSRMRFTRREQKVASNNDNMPQCSDDVEHTSTITLKKDMQPLQQWPGPHKYQDRIASVQQPKTDESIPRVALMDGGDIHDASSIASSEISDISLLTVIHCPNRNKNENDNNPISITSNTGSPILDHIEDQHFFDLTENVVNDTKMALPEPMAAGRNINQCESSQIIRRNVVPTWSRRNVKPEETTAERHDSAYRTHGELPHSGAVSWPSEGKEKLTLVSSTDERPESRSDVRAPSESPQNRAVDTCCLPIRLTPEKYYMNDLITPKDIARLVPDHTRSSRQELVQNHVEINLCSPIRKYEVRVRHKYEVEDALRMAAGTHGQYYHDDEHGTNRAHVHVSSVTSKTAGSLKNGPFRSNSMTTAKRHLKHQPGNSTSEFEGQRLHTGNHDHVRYYKHTSGSKVKVGEAEFDPQLSFLYDDMLPARGPCVPGMTIRTKTRHHARSKPYSRWEPSTKPRAYKRHGPRQEVSFSLDHDCSKSENCASESSSQERSIPSSALRHRRMGPPYRRRKVRTYFL